MEPYGTLPTGKKGPKKLSYSDLEPYGTIWNHMEPFLELKRGTKNQITQIWNNKGPYGTILNHMEPNGTKWSPS